MVEIREDLESGFVMIDGLRIEGFVDNQACSACGTQRVFFDDFAAFFCPACNRWLEDGCDDSLCNFCSRRPAVPLERS